MPPPLPRIASGYALSAPAPVTVELFLDLVCPFSRKLWLAVRGGVVDKFPGITFVVNQVVQPWHPAGAWVHEAALAVKAASPQAYPSFVDAVFASYDAGRLQDESTWDSTRPQVYAELIELAAGAGADRGSVEAALKLKEGGGGTGATLMKWACKYHRARGVHVTPTVHVNGLEAGLVSSSWTTEQWGAFLEPMGADNFTGTKL